MTREVEPRAGQVDPVAAHRGTLGAEPGERLFLQSADRPAVRPDHPPPGHRGTVRDITDPTWRGPPQPISSAMSE